MSLTILGIGTAQPTHSVEQRDAAEFAVTTCGATAEHARMLHVLYRRSGVERRSSVLIEREAGAESRQSFFLPPLDELDRGPTTAARNAQYAAESPALALAAASRAVSKANVPAKSIRHLVTASCTGFVAPGFDIALIQELELPATVTRTHLGFMGCHAAFNAMRVAAAMVAADPGSHALVCTTELCSLHFQYGNEPDSMVSNALFADGAGAVVFGDRTPGADEWVLAKTGSCLFPDSLEALTWNIGDHGFEMRLSSRVPDLIRAHLRTWFESWLGEQGLSIAEVGSWAIHPGGPRIVQGVMSALELPAGADVVSRQVLAECGNMSSPTILFILQRLFEQSAPRPCVAIGFGPGLMVETALFR